MVGLLHIENYINGAFVASEENKIETRNPATGALIALVPDSSADDVDLAVRAAKDAFPMYCGLLIEVQFYCVD